jgi:hypothetical protein
MRKYSTIKYFFSFLLILFTLNIQIPKVSSDNISEASIEKATREVNRKALPEDFPWADRQKPEMRGEDGELLDPLNEGSNSSFNSSAEELPPCSPGKLTLRGKY